MTLHSMNANLISRIKSGRVTVIGIGISNIPLIDYLIALGADVSARDVKSAADLMPVSRSLERAGVKLILGSGYLEDITEDVIFRSPGVRPWLPEIMDAVSRGALLISEMELFMAICPAYTIGVTGSDGKTTTTTLIYNILKRNAESVRNGDVGRANVYVGGNIGVPLLPLTQVMTPDDFAVAELSSFQLQTMQISPRRAVVTNLSPNHLDWHHDMAEYSDAKRNIFSRNTNTGGAVERFVTNADCAAALDFAINADVPLTLFSSIGHCYGDIVPESLSGAAAVYESGGWIIYENITRAERVLEVGRIKLPGRHNLENYMAAIGAVYGLASNDAIAAVAGEFGGVEHRCEFVREVGGVKFYNSSIDSSPTRTAAAISNFACGDLCKDISETQAGNKKTAAPYIVTICGGADKNIPLAPLAEVLCEKADAVVLTGATAGAIKTAIISRGNSYPRTPQIIESGFGKGGFREAVLAAYRAALNATPNRGGKIVLLSPACASFDAFRNFEERGNYFKEIVSGLLD